MTHAQKNTLKRLGWFFGIWLASIIALAAVSLCLKALMQMAGLHA
jgi:hypothetical protein